MPTDFEIIPRLGIVFIQHSGFLTVEECMDDITKYVAHPDAAPGQKHLVDCSAVTDYERNWSRILGIQARMADVVPATGPETLLVLYAPEGIPRDLAVLICRSWDGVGTVLPRIAETESEAIALVGAQAKTFPELLSQKDIAQ